MENFEWKLTDAEKKLIKDANEGKAYQAIFAELTTNPSEIEVNRNAYEWGDGWDCDENRRKWENDVHGRLESAGYQLRQDDVEQGYYIATCHDDKTTLYINPSEITGYVKAEKKEELLNILKSSSEIQSVKVQRDAPGCELSDKAYEKIISRNSNRIFADIKASHERRGLNTETVAREWVKENRIPRLGDTMGVMMSDIDFKEIQNIAEQYKSKGKLVQKENLER